MVRKKECLVIAFFLAFVFCCAAEAQGVMSRDEIEKEIAVMSQMDVDEITKIQQAIDSQESAQEQIRLRQLLDGKIEGLLVSPGREPVDGELKAQIDILKFGESATVEDLRQRDAVVTRIAAVQDPVMRYELLEYLKRKEAQEGP